MSRLRVRSMPAPRKETACPDKRANRYGLDGRKPTERVNRSPGWAMPCVRVHVVADRWHVGPACYCGWG